MEIKRFKSNIKNDNLDDVNLKMYEDDNENNTNISQEKDNIEIIRRQEYLLQMKTEVKFPIYKILQKYNYIQENEEYKLCSKVRINSSKNNFINYIQNSNNLINNNKDSILDISNEIYEGNNLLNDNNNNNFDNDSEECQTGYLFIFQDKIILTNNQIENLKKSLKQNPVLYSIKFSQFCIFRLIINDTSQNELYLQFYDNSFICKKDLMLKFLIIRDSFCVHHFIKKYFILQWQIIFESTIIFDYKKLIYNRHYILLKYNKYDKCQERTLLVTNGLLLNIKHDFKKFGLHFSIKNVQWAIGIKAIKKIVIMIEAKNENKLKIYLDKITNNAEVVEFLGNTKYLKFKEERNFEFYSVDERNDFVGLMRRNYFLLTNKFIMIDCYPPINKKRSKTNIVTNNIFDSSFESSDEDTKINEKAENNNKDKIVDKPEDKIIKDIELKEQDNDKEIKNEIKKEENDKKKITEIKIKEDKNKEKEEHIKPNNDGNNKINIENKEQKGLNVNKITNKNGDKKNYLEDDKNDKLSINKNIKKTNIAITTKQKKTLKKTKKSIFDDDYNNIFDSDYESEEDK